MSSISPDDLNAKGPRPREDDPHPTGPGSGVKRQRKGRQILSCDECKRRKIACNRSSPCAPCVARGDGAFCRFKAGKTETNDTVLATQNGAAPLSTDSLPELALRLHFLEDLFASKFSDAPRYSAPPAPPPLSQIHDAQSSPEGGTEDAVLALEDLATKGLSKHYGAMGVSASDGPNTSANDLLSSSTTWSPSILLPEPPIGTMPPALAILLGPMNASQITPFQCILATIPSFEVAEALIQTHLDEVDWRWHVLHTPTFQEEFRQFWTLSPGERETIDPAWLATLLQLLSLGAAEALQAELTPLLADCPLIATGEAPAVWHEAARMGLRLANWTIKPQIRVLQCLILFGASLDQPGGPLLSRQSGFTSPDNGFSIWLASATRIAYLLGLNRLGTEVERMPALDPSLPSFPCALRREMGVRLWHWLVVLDLKTNFMTGDYLINPSIVNTGPLQNFEDVDLGLSVNAVPRSSWEFSSASYLRYQLKLGEHCKRVAQLVESKGTADYKAVLRLEAEFKESVRSLIPPNDSLHSFSLETTINNRILRLHRPYMVKGYQAKEFEYSTLTSLDSAERILLAQQKLEGSMYSYSWFTVSHSLGACLCLFVDTFVRRFLGQPPVPQRLQLIQDARERFERQSAHPSRSIRALATKAANVVDTIRSKEVEQNEPFTGQKDGSIDLGPLFRTVAASMESAETSPMAGLDSTTSLFQFSNMWPQLMMEDSAGQLPLDNTDDWSQFWGSYLVDPVENPS